MKDADTSTSGLAGVTNLFVACYSDPKNEIISGNIANATAYSDIVSQFSGLSTAFVSFSSDFLDPLVCPFSVFRACLNFISNDDCTKDFNDGHTLVDANGNDYFQDPLGDSNAPDGQNNGSYCCPIINDGSDKSKNRKLKCAKVAFACILGKCFV